MKPTKSKGPTAKKAKLDQVQEDEDSDDDEEVTEEPIKRERDIKNLKRKIEKTQNEEAVIVNGK